MKKNKGDKIAVVTFDKRYWQRDWLESLNDGEKYRLALISKNGSICSAEEYTKSLNDMRPMERCVFTYIVAI